MDSMRSLNSSLPSSRSNRATPPEQLLQAFRTAALSVTNLYKSAATEQANSRQAGYQEALQDLLDFLDAENIGVQDGEGWRVRQWATVRYDGRVNRQNDSEAEEEPDETEKELDETDTRNRETSQENEDIPVVQDRAESTRSDSEQEAESSSAPHVFQFTSNNTHGENGMQLDDSRSASTLEHPSSSQSHPIRVEVLNRRNRSTSRTHNTRSNTRATPREFTFTSGTKRKIQFPDFFDISNLNDKQDGSGGSSGASKKGRFS